MSKPRKKRVMNPDLAGKPIHRWTVLSKIKKEGRAEWLCRCECGTEKLVSQSNLLGGLTRSCGCFNKEQNSKDKKIHGKSRTSIYTVWSNMKSRCYYSGNTEYASYGGRGIKVCDRWFHSFENFLLDMGEPPTDQHTIDRIDNNGNYEPVNCRWATKQEQSRNKSTTRLIEYNGVTKTLTEWSQEYGIKSGSLHYRLFIKKMPFEKAITEPVNTPRKKG